MLLGIVFGGGEGRLEEIEQNFNTLSLFLLWVPLNYLQVRAELWLQIDLIGGDRNLWNFWESNPNLAFSSQRLNWLNCPIPVLIWHNQTLHFPHCLNSVPFLVMGMTHCIGHPFLVAVRQYWWLLLSRWPTLLTKANDPFTDCSWSGWSPAGCTTFFTCVRCKFLYESIKSQFFRGNWLLRLAKLRDCNTCFYPLSRGWRSVFILFHLCQLTEQLLTSLSTLFVYTCDSWSSQ
jgi:hypothetical protein